MQCNAMQCNAMQCDAMRCNAMQCNAMRCYAMWYDAMQWNAMLCTCLPIILTKQKKNLKVLVQQQQHQLHEKQSVEAWAELCSHLKTNDTGIFFDNFLMLLELFWMLIFENWWSNILFLFPSNFRGIQASVMPSTNHTGLELSLSFLKSYPRNEWGT